MNVYVAIGGRVDWSNEGGDEYAPRVIGVYSSRALATNEAQVWVNLCLAEGDYLGDEFWFEVEEKSLDGA